MKYLVYGVIGATIRIGEVEAVDEAEAQEKADELPIPHYSLCHQCGSDRNATLELGEGIAEIKVEPIG